MRLFIKIKKRSLCIDLRTLAKKIWGVKQDDFWINRYGIVDTLDTNHQSAFWLMPSDFREDWEKVHLKWDTDEIVVQPVKKCTDQIVVFNDYETPLPFNEKAMYNLVAYIAQQLDGKISEDDGKTWITLKEFQNEHNKIMRADFDKLLAESAAIGAVTAPKDDPKFYELLNN